MNRFEKNKLIGDNKKNIIDSLWLNKLDKRICDRIVIAAQNQGWNIGNAIWFSNAGLMVLVKIAKIVKTNMIKEGQDIRVLNRLINTWIDWIGHKWIDNGVL